MSSLRINRQKVIDFTIISLIVLAAMDFMLHGWWFIGIAFVFCIIFFNGKLRVNNVAILLSALTVSYLAFEMIVMGNMSWSIVAAPLAFVVAYQTSGDRDEGYASRMLLIVAAAMAIHGILSWAYSFAQYGIAGFYTGRSYDIWTGTYRAATGIASNYYLLATTISLLFHRQSFRLKILHIVLLAACVMHNILIGGRIFLVLCLIEMLGIVAFETFSKKGWRALIKYGMVFSVGLLAAIVIYRSNLFEVKSLFESSYLHKRFFASESVLVFNDTDRWELKIEYLKNLLKYPFGGGILHEQFGNYAHDIWLDTFDRVGIVPMLIMFVYTIGSVFRFFRYVRLPNLPEYARTMFAIFPVVMMAGFFVEPIMRGAPMIFFMFCFMDGVISRKLSEGKA